MFRILMINLLCSMLQDKDWCDKCHCANPVPVTDKEYLQGHPEARRLRLEQLREEGAL